MKKPRGGDVRNMVRADDLRKMEKALRKKNARFRTIMTLARHARDYADKIAKKGVKVDEEALRAFIFSPNRLLSAGGKAGVKSIVRALSTIEVADGLEVNYEQYFQAKQAIDRFNKSVRGYNEYHKAEIEAGTLEARKEKKWTLGEKDTVESAERWLRNSINVYQKGTEYQETLRLNYINNMVRAIERTAPVGMDYLISFFRENLTKYVDYNMEWYTSVSYVYRPEEILSIYKKIASHYEFGDEWNALVEKHSEDFRDLRDALISS